MLKTFAIALILLLTGCATVLGRSAETISFDSDPQGIQVVVDGNPHKTPFAVTLGTDKDHQARFPNGRVVMIERSFNGWFLGNIVLGGLLGMAIDIIGGGIKKNLEPDSFLYRDGTIYVGDKILTAEGRLVKPKDPKKKSGEAKPRYGRKAGP